MNFPAFVLWFSTAVIVVAGYTLFATRRALDRAAASIARSAKWRTWALEGGDKELRNVCFSHAPDRNLVECNLWVSTNMVRRYGAAEAEAEVINTGRCGRGVAPDFDTAFECAVKDLQP